MQVVRKGHMYAHPFRRSLLFGNYEHNEFHENMATAYISEILTRSVMYKTHTSKDRLEPFSGSC